jgi:hypothetical protein
MYATKQQFGGQRASIGRQVVVKGSGYTSPWNGSKMHPRTRSGTVDGIDDQDRPIIESSALNNPGVEEKIRPGNYKERSSDLAYFDAKTEEDIEHMPPGSWCWPPRVS